VCSEASKAGVGHAIVVGPGLEHKKYAVTTDAKVIEVFGFEEAAERRRLETVRDVLGHGWALCGPW
jgi:hypothetical protein